MQKGPGKAPAARCELEEQEVLLVAFHACKLQFQLKQSEKSLLSRPPSPNTAIKICNNRK